MDEKTEKALVEKAAFDASCFGRLYDYYFPLIYKYVRWKVNTNDDAQDLVSLVFEKALMRLKSGNFRFQEGATFKSWLFRIAHNTIIDHYRSGVHREFGMDENIEFASEDKMPSQVAEHNALMRQIQVFISEMPDAQRDVMQMRYFADMSNKEIAVSLEISEKTVSSYLSRGADHLYKRLHDK